MSIMDEQSHTVPGTIIWIAPFYNRSGYGVGSRAAVSALHRAGARIRIISVNEVEPGIDDCDMSLIKSLETTPVIPPITTIINHVPSRSWLNFEVPEPNLRIMATTFDGSIQGALPPAEWIELCNEMDQVWLMSEKEREIFISAGIAQEKIHIVYWPHSWLENPCVPSPAPEAISPEKPFRFLSIAMFQPRRRWDTLIEAYLEEFKGDSEVELYLKVNYPSWHPVPGKPRRDLHDLITSLRRKTRSEASIIIDEDLGTRTGILNLIDSCSCYISTDTAPTAPITEARVRQRIVLVPDGVRHALGLVAEDHVPILVDPDAKTPLTQEMLLYQPHHKDTFMPRLHVGDVRRSMRRTYDMPVEERRARAVAASHIPGPTQTNPMAFKAIDAGWRYRAELENKKKPQKPAAKITWEGSQLVGHSLAFVNRELCLRLIDSGHEVSIVPFEKNDAEIAADPRFKKIVERTRKPLSGKADVHVRHQWPPNFNPPPEGHWVIIQPWEFGSLPKAWVHPMSTLVDEIWVPSAFVRESFIGSGIPADRVFVIPNGVDTRIFNPAAPPIRLNTKKRFKFLFVGGTIARKGIDILLDVYTGTFSDKDDVCLVIKDMGAKTFYRDRTAQDLIRERQSLPGAPEIEYIDHMLSDKDMAGLYTACDCLVHPYKGEGFGLPIAESMACERPVIITGYGAALDFCSEESAYLLSSRIVLFPEKRLDNFETVSFPWLAEPNREHLRKIMKHICEHPSELKLKGKAGCNRISRDFTWERAAEMVEDRIQALAAKPILRFHASARAEHEAYPPVLPAVRATSPGTELPGLILPENTGSPEQAAQSRSKDAPRNPGIAGQEDTAGILTAQGELQFERGRPDRARTCFEMALDENPAHAAALSNLGVICLREGKVTEALEFLRKALDSDSESPDILLNSARALQAAGELDSAAELLKIYLQKYPDDEDVWEEHVEVIRQSARPVWTQEGLPGQVADLYVESGKLLAFAGDILGAAASFQKAMKLDPERPEPYFLLGQLHLEIGQKEEAAEYFHAGISVAPPGNGTVPMPGGILVSRDRREEAEALYDSLLSAHSG